MSIIQNQIGVSTIGADLTLIDTQVFTANGTWTAPVGANYVDVLIIGGGGGGGSGACGTTGTYRLGGNGGNGASCLYVHGIPIGVLGATEAVTVGAGGAGASGVGTSASNGNTGSFGGRSTFYLWQASGGVPGKGGRTGATLGGNFVFDGASGLVNYTQVALGLSFRDDTNLAALTSSQPLVAQNQSVGASVSSNGTNGSIIVLTGVTVPTGGTAGAGIDGLNVVNPNTTWNVDNYEWGNTTPPIYVSVQTVNAAPVIVAGSSTTGNNGSTFATYYGVGGTGGYSVVSGNGYAGGNGGLYGSGGGGGGACLNGFTSGAGGNGANGIVVVFSYT